MVIRTEVLVANFSMKRFSPTFGNSLRRLIGRVAAEENKIIRCFELSRTANLLTYATQLLTFCRVPFAQAAPHNFIWVT